MNAQTVIESATDIVLAIEQSPQIALLDAEKYSAFFQRVKAETETLVPDTSTAKGRDEIRAMAAKVVKTKTAIDKARLALTSQWREQTSQVNAAGKRIESELEALADHVREPLTVWENAEKVRKNTCDDTINRIVLAGIVTLEDTAATVRERGKEIWNIEIDEAYFQGQYETAIKAKTHNIDMLKMALARLTKEEADRAELEQLRAAQAEREAREQAERDAAEAKEREAAAAKAAEEKRIADEKAEDELIERARKNAADAAQREAEKKAQEAQAQRDREYAQIIAAERKAKEDAEREVQMQREAILQKEKQDKAMADQLAAEQAARDADKAHRTKVMKAAKEAIMSCGADEETAKKIILLIRSGEVPNVSMRF